MLFPRKRQQPQIPVGDVIIYPGDSVHIALPGNSNGNENAEKTLRNWYFSAGVKDVFITWINGGGTFAPRVVSVMRGRGR